MPSLGSVVRDVVAWGGLGDPVLFVHYPPGTFDASSTTCCIGFEHRIADG